jgi:hypothetical protein
MTINAISRQLRLTSIPMVHSPGMIRWILATIAPFDQPKAIDLLEAMGLKTEDAVRIAAKDPTIHIAYNDEDGTVLFSFDA